ncbi:hypothetical protein [Paenibacillus kobensis]|uniref:hypothetical protein n=1 Tax=Paenibacillus kobensis TaxID=59841 RepID=UPI000FDA6F7E|nr:hypothetical protein [Paenibacillus kobensis]
MTRVTLPLAQPPIISYLHHAYPLSVVSGREEVLPWLYSQYVQLRCFKDVHAYKYRDLFNFYTTSSKMLEIVPHLQVERIPKSFIMRWTGDPVQFLTESIDQGYCCIIYVRQHYHEKLFYFHDVDYTHELMIFGYDKEEKQFDLYGFNGDDNLVKFRRSFDEVIELWTRTPVEQEWQAPVNLIRYNPEGSFDFRIDNLADVIEDYLTGADSTLRFMLWKFPVDHESAFGIDVYPLVLQMLNEVERGELFLDYRIYHLIWEHKRLMTERLRYLENKRFLSSDRLWSVRYEAVENTALAIRLGVLKAIKTRSESDLSNLKRLVGQMVEQEVELLTGVVQELRHISANGADAAGEPYAQGQKA